VGTISVHYMTDIIVVSKYVFALDHVDQ